MRRSHCAGGAVGVQSLFGLRNEAHSEMQAFVEVATSVSSLFVL